MRAAGVKWWTRLALVAVVASAVPATTAAATLGSDLAPARPIGATSRPWAGAPAAAEAKAGGVELLCTTDAYMFTPWGVATNESLDIYVADRGNNRVLRFDKHCRRYSGAFEKPPGGFNAPDALAFGNDHVYVADTGNGKVRIYTPDGRYVKSFGTLGSAPGQLKEPNGIAVDRCSGDVYVTEGQNWRVSVFNANGAFINSFGEFGDGPMQFQHPVAITAGDLCRMYISDERGGITVMNRYSTTSYEFGEPGTAPGQLSFSDEVAVDTRRDGKGAVWVVESGTSRVSKFTHSGTSGLVPRYEYAYSFAGSPAATLSSPHGLTMDQQGRLIVANTGEGTVSVFAEREARAIVVGPLGTRSTINRTESLRIKTFYNLLDSTCDGMVKVTVAIPGQNSFVVENPMHMTQTGGEATDTFVTLTDGQAKRLKRFWRDNPNRDVRFTTKLSMRCTTAAHIVRDELILTL